MAALRIIALWAGLALILDQASKYVVLVLLDLDAVGRLVLLPGLVEFRMAWNRGVNFGLFSGPSDNTRLALIALALIISVWVCIWQVRSRQPRLSLISAGLLVGGAIGNVIDRVLHGAVADFLNVTCCGIANPFSFNLADAVIFLGAVGLVAFARSADS